MNLNGRFPRCSDSSAIGGKADVLKRGHRRRVWPRRSGPQAAHRATQ